MPEQSVDMWLSGSTRGWGLPRQAVLVPSYVSHSALY
jgi:hypothetical protein